MIHVQFADDSESEIVSYFACNQDPAVHENLGSVEASDPRWLTYYASLSDTGTPLFGIPVPEEEPA